MNTIINTTIKTTLGVLFFSGFAGAQTNFDIPLTNPTNLNPTGPTSTSQPNYVDGTSGVSFDVQGDLWVNSSALLIGFPSSSPWGGTTSTTTVNFSSLVNDIILSVNFVSLISSSGETMQAFTTDTGGTLTLSLDSGIYSANTLALNAGVFGYGSDDAPSSNNSSGGMKISSTNPFNSLTFDMTRDNTTTGIQIANISGTAVPEPTSMALLGFGALGFIIRRKR